MSRPYEVQTAIDDLLERRPDLIGARDDILYEYVKRENPQLSWASKDKTRKRKKKYKVNTEPSFVNTFQSWFDGPISESGMFSYDWMKEGYNRSLTGAVEELMTGEARYELDDYNLNWAEDIGATVLSFMMPLDLIAMTAGGGIGKGAFYASGLAKRATVEMGKKAWPTIVPTMLGQMGSLGVYEGAIGGVQAAQKGEDVMPAIVHGLWHGGLLGAAAGFAGGGIAFKNAKLIKGFENAGKLAIAGKKATTAMTHGDRIRQISTGMPGQIVGESATFTSVETAERVFKGEDVRVDEILKSFAHNLGLFTVLKGKHKLLNRGKKHLDMLREYEATNSANDPLNPGKSKNSKVFGEQQAKWLKLAKAAEEAGELDLRDHYLDLAKEMRIEELKIDEEHGGQLKELDRIRAKIDNIRDVGKDPGVDYVKDVLEGLNSIVGVQEKLLEKGTGKGEIYEAMRGEVMETQAEFIELLDSFRPHGKVKTKAELQTEAEILLKDKWNANAEIPSADKKSGRVKIQEATKEELESHLKIFKETTEYQVDLERRRKTTFEPTEEIDSILDLKSTEDFVTEGRAEGQEIFSRKEKIAEKIEKIEADKPYEKGSKSEKLHETDKKYIKYLLQKLFPDHVPDKSNTYIDIDMVKRMATHLEGFSHFLKLKGKSFETMEKKDITNYLRQEGKTSHKTAISHLVREINVLSQGLKEPINRKIIGIDAGKISTVAKKGMTLEEQIAATGARVEQVDIKAGVIYKQTTKKGKFKQTPMSTKFRNVIAKLVTKAKDLGKDNFIFRRNDKVPFIQEDVNRIMSHFFGTKKWGKAEKTASAKLFRTVMQDWASGKEFLTKGQKAGEGISYHDIISVFGMGQKEAKYLESNYGIKEARGRKLFAQIHKQFIKDIEGHISGKKKLNKKIYGVKDETAYNLIEIAEGLKKITSLKGKVKGKEIPVVIDGIEYSKETIEGLSRWLIENPSRLNEVAFEKYEKFDLTKEIREEDYGVKYQLEKEASKMKTTVEEITQQREHFKKVLPMIDVFLKNTLGKYQGEYVLGRITGKIVEIAKDRAKADTIPHEMSHYVVDILREFGDARSMELIRKGESKKFFGSEEKLVQAIGEYAAGRMRNKTKIQKAKTWVQEFWSNMRTKVGWYTAEDITRTIGKKVVEGKIPVGEINEFTIKHQTSGPTKKGINGFINAGGDNSLKENVKREALNDYNRALKDIFGTTDLEGYLKNADVDQMVRFRDFLENHPSNGGGSKNSIPLKIEEVNDKYHIEPVISREILKDMGVKDGEYGNASPETRKQYESLIRNNNDLPQARETSFDNNTRLAEGGFKLPSAYARAIMPVWLVLKHHGGKPGRMISDSLLNHEWAEHVLYKGTGDKAINLIKKALGSNSKHVALWDVPRTEERIKLTEKMKAEGKSQKEIVREGGLTQKQISFFNNSFKEGTTENVSHRVWRTLSDKYWRSLKEELSRHISPQMAEKMVAELDQTYVEGYMTRRLTNDAIKYLDKSGKLIKDLVQKNIKNAAKKEAKKKLEGKSSEEIENEALKLVEDVNFETKVRTELYDAILYGYASVKNPHLIPRKGLLKEYVNITNEKGHLKRIKVYDDSIGGTAETYVKRMSKFLATTRYFPEWTGFGTKYKMGTSKRKIMEAMEGDKNLGGYAIKSIKRQIGLDKNQFEALSAPAYRGAGTLAHTSALVGLSSPLSGVKNLAIGIPRAIGDFGFMNTMRALRHGFDSSKYNEARGKGYLEYGAKTLELETVGWEKWNMAKFFKINLMTQSENFNRIVSANAGQTYFAEVTAKLRGEKGMFEMSTTKDRMRTVMEELWHLDPEQIKFLETTKDFKTKEAMEIHADILNKVGHFSHVSSQGGTSTIMLPLWMSSKEAKPLTLFQRMATSTTIDTYRNFVKPLIDYGNPMPILRASMAHAVSGAALWGIYDKFLGKEPPKGSAEGKNDDLNSLMLNLWRSEFLGVFGEVLSPYEKEMMIPLSFPIILRNGSDVFKQASAWMGEKKTLEQAGFDLFKNAVVVYNQYDTYKKNQASPYYEKFKRLRTMVRTFKKERGMSQLSGDGIVNRRQPYYRDLKDSLIFGTDEEIAQSYWKAFDFIVTDYEQTNKYSTPAYRIKQAKAAIKNSIRLYNPMNISDSIKGTRMSLRKQFYDWLDPENTAMAKEIEKIYQYRLRKYDRIVGKPKWRKLYSVYPYA